MNERNIKKAGFINLRALFWLVFFAAGIYGAYMYGPPYASYYMLKTEVEGEAKTAHMYSDEELASRIIRKAAAWSVSLNDEKLEVIRGAEDIRISVHYTVDINFFDRYHHVIAYDIDVQEPLKDKGRELR